MSDHAFRPEEFAVGREPLPEEEVMRSEQAELEAQVEFNANELEIVRRVWLDLRRLKPHLYVVMKTWSEMLQLRDEPTQYSSRVYRGFYAELSRKLGITENAVKYRLQSGIRWFAHRLRKTAGTGKTS